VSYFNWANGEPKGDDAAGIWGYPDQSWLEWDDQNSAETHHIICESNAL